MSRRQQFDLHTPVEIISLGEGAIGLRSRPLRGGRARGDRKIEAGFTHRERSHRAKDSQPGRDTRARHKIRHATVE